MKSDRARTQAAIVIKWPQAVPAPPAREITRRLVAGRIPATWAIDQFSQVESLASWNIARAGAEAALLVPAGVPASADPGPDGPTRELARRLELLRTSGLSVDVLHAAPDLVGGQWPRALRALGVHGVVVDGAPEGAGARALPFGVWQFAPQANIPETQRWLRWLTGRRRSAFAAPHGAPAVVTIDLTRAGIAGSRAWHDVETALEQAAQYHVSGAVELTTIGDLAARLARSNAPRPQRSILRAA